ncbi:protein THEM6 [Acyrthosiphon pisum]|uniref:Protein THEM6 n=1 Tax=Acyrthosiphon pisum TaxID=7029 RepID=A0A8R2H374_ACYPI|nr:protein THEM6 [Acyrthosiphon pisum]
MMMSLLSSTTTAPAASAVDAAAGTGSSALTVTALTVACATLALILVLMCALDLPYFFRSLFSYVAATCIKKKLRVTDTAVYSSVCLTTDLDVYLTHMNNARYLREIDLARIEFLLRTGLWQELRRRGGLIFTISNSVRYRKFVRTFSRYEIRTRIVYWDDMSIFFEFRFVSKADGFIRAIVYNRQRVVDCSADELMRTVIGGGASAAAKTADADNAYRRPECPIEIHHWIQSNLMSSAILKAEMGDGDPL